jgi:hypothetical protein
VRGALEKGEDEKEGADDEAADGGGEGVGAQAELDHAEASDGDGPHQQPRAAERVRAHGHVLELELAHEERGECVGARVEAAGEDAVQGEEREEDGAHLDEERADGHDHVQPLHEVNPLVARPVNGGVGRRGAKKGERGTGDRQGEEGGEEHLRLHSMVAFSEPNARQHHHRRDRKRRASSPINEGAKGDGSN